MQYYQFHLGDYISHTAHLEPLEDLAYRRLLDLYYSTEKPIPNDIPSVSRRLRLGIDVIEIVLNEFFELSEAGWQNHRCNVEISKFNEWIDKQKANGRKGGRPRKQPQDKPKKTHGIPTANPSKSDGKPIAKPPTTHNPLPTTHNPTDGERAGFPEEFKNFLQVKTAGTWQNDLQKWRGEYAKLANQVDADLPEVFTWATKNYRAGIGAAKWFIESTWPKIWSAYQDKKSSLSPRVKAQLAQLDKEDGI